MKNTTTIKTPIKRAEGLGSAHHGMHHWLLLRIGSVALIPLTVWFVAVVINLSNGQHTSFVEFFKIPLNALLMALFIGFSFHHTALGLQEVIEDYVHSKFKKTASLIVIRFGLLLMGALTIMAIVKLHFSL